MFKIQIHATGSAGNAYSICDGDHKILIDPGIPIKKLRKKVGYNLATLDFCLVSHEHKDHSKAVKDLARLGVLAIMSQGTAKALDFNGGVVEMGKGCSMTQKGWQIMPFETQHDAAEPQGFLIQSPSGKKICYATDTYYIKYIFSGVTHWMIEANYSEALLQKNNSLNATIKSRIRTSHFEIENVKKFFKEQDLSATEKIYLIHLSDDNSDQALFKKEIEGITGKPVCLG